MKNNVKRIAVLFICMVFTLSLFAGQTGLLSVVSAETATVDIDVEKKWVDNDNEDGNRPETVTVYLMNGNETVQTLILKASEGWKGKFTEVPRFDEGGSEISYFVVENPSDGYSSAIITGEQTDGYTYPSNVSATELDPTGNVKEKIKAAGGTGWDIQPGLETDIIPGSQITIASSWNVNEITYTEYDADGNIVPEAEKVFVGKISGDSLYIGFKLGSGSAKYVSTDHILKVTIPNSIVIQDGTQNGFTTALELTFDNITVYKCQDIPTTCIAKIIKNQIWAGGSGAYINASGNVSGSGSTSPVWQDITIRIPGITEGQMLFTFTDVDIPKKIGNIVANESVGLKSGFEKTIYTLPLKTANATTTKTSYLDFKENADGSLTASACNGNDTGSTFQSGFAVIGNFSEEGIKFSSVTADNATWFFPAVTSGALQVTVDGLTYGGNGGSVNEQHGWMNRGYGEAKVITLNPDEFYHINTVTIDGKNVDLGAFDENGILTIETGYTGRGKTTKENVTFYQRENGVIDIWLPAQYFAKNNTGAARVDHNINVTFAPNGIIKSYTLVGTATKSISGTKTWVCGDDTHPANEALTLKVMQKLSGASDETAAEYLYNHETQLSWSGNTYTIQNLPIYDEEGNEFEYFVTEVPLAGYTTTYDENNRNNIINTVNQQYVSVQGKVTWVDNGAYEHDNEEEIVMHLYRKSEKEGSVQEEIISVTAAWNGNNYIFENLPLFDEEGYRYTYSVAETLGDITYLPQGDSYGTEADDTGFNFINTIKGDPNVGGTITWVCGDIEHPANETLELTLKRKLAGEDDSTAVVIETDDDIQLIKTDSGYSFTGLEKYDENGVPYVYTVTETAPEGYTVSYDSENPYNITNTIIQQYVSVEGTVTWKDGNLYEHDNAEEFTVTLVRKSTKTGSSEETLDVTAVWDGNKYTFENLPKFDGEGYEYGYSVKGSVSDIDYLPEGDSYECTSDDTGCNFTNTLTGTVKVSGEVIWEDPDDIEHENDSESKIHVKRKSSAPESSDEELNDTYTWTDDEYSFGDMPKYDENGYLYTYTVSQDDIENYETEYEGNNIKNTYIPQDQTVTVHYLFDDGTKAADDTILTVKEFESYNLDIPAIDGCTPSEDSISGEILRGTPVEITVVYTVNPGTGDRTGSAFGIVCAMVLCVLTAAVVYRVKREN